MYVLWVSVWVWFCACATRWVAEMRLGRSSCLQYLAALRSSALVNGYKKGANERLQKQRDVESMFLQLGFRDWTAWPRRCLMSSSVSKSAAMKIYGQPI